MLLGEVREEAVVNAGKWRWRWRWTGVWFNALFSENVERVDAYGNVEPGHLKVWDGTAGGCAVVRGARVVGERW